LDHRCEIRYRLVPLVEANLSIAAEHDGSNVIGLQLQRFPSVGQRLFVILLQERNLSPTDIGAFIFRRQLNGLGKIRGRFRLKEVNERAAKEVMFRYEVAVEIEGADKPAIVAEWLTMAVLA